MSSTTTLPSSAPALSQRDLVLASLRRGVGRDNCAGEKNGHGTPAAGAPTTAKA